MFFPFPSLADNICNFITVFCASDLQELDISCPEEEISCLFGQLSWRMIAISHQTHTHTLSLHLCISHFSCLIDTSARRLLQCGWNRGSQCGGFTQVKYPGSGVTFATSRASFNSNYQPGSRQPQLGSSVVAPGKIVLLNMIQNLTKGFVKPEIFITWVRAATRSHIYSLDTWVCSFIFNCLCGK